MPTLDQNQQRFLDLTVSGQHPVVCSTVAGGGKTFTIAQTYEALLDTGVPPQDILICCLNKHNREDLMQKTGAGTRTVKTYDSVAWQQVANTYKFEYDSWRLQQDKFSNLLTLFAMEYFQSSDGLTAEQWQDIEMCDTLREFCMNCLVDPCDWPTVEKLVDAYGLEMPDPQFAQQALPTVFRWGKEGSPRPYRGGYHSLREGFDFAQLLWLVNKDPDVTVRARYSHVLTDERQDCNRAQAQLLNRITAGYQYSVGDVDQQLYAFMGSDLYGWKKLIGVVDTVVVDSPITYRCPKAVVRYVNGLVPRMQAAPDALEGSVRDIRQSELYKHLRIGDVWVTKTNSDAIQIALKCIAQGMPAYVKGRSIGAMQLHLLDTLADRKDFKFLSLLDYLQSWTNQQVHLLTIRLRDPNRQIAQVYDRQRSLEALFSAAVKEGVRELPAFRVYIERLFKDDSDPRKVMVASTIWKFKGLENDRIFMWQTDSEPNPLRYEREWEQRQDRNASIVGRTRSLKDLYLVGAGGIFDTDDPDFI